MYTAYVLTDSARQQMLEKYPAAYDYVVAHHITVEFGVSNTHPVPEPAKVEVVGHVDIADGIEAFVVTVNGKTKRPDGKVYHITWSIDPKSNHKPVDSNKLIKDNGYDKLVSFEIETEPKLLK